MSIADGDVALLARQAVDLLSEDIEIKIEPDDPADPYRFGAQAWVVYPLIDGHRSFGIRLYSATTAVDALAHLLDQLSEYASESERFWGVAFPVCPGHLHPAHVAVDRADVVLRCPASAAEVRRIRPDTF